MNIPAENPKAIVGDNRSVDWARTVADQLKRDYPHISATVEALLAEGRALYAEPVTEENKGRYVALIKRIRDEAAKIDAYHTAEKEPHLRSGQAVDQFFLGFIEALKKRDRKAKPGAADHLQDRLDDYVNEQIERERAERERARIEAERVAREAREKAEREQRAADEARAAAERARKPEHIEAKTDAAEQQEAKADLAVVHANIASDDLHDATTAAAAKGADIVRTRLDEGAMLTARQEGYADIINDADLDKTLLWPFIKAEEKERALRAWAKTSGFKVQMAGARIGHRHKAVGR